MATVTRDDDLPAGPTHPPTLLQLLNNLANHLSSPLHHQSYHHHYYPRFDIEEHAYSYEIYGDLPGVQRASLHIAILDEHTLEISGTTTDTAATAAARHRPSDPSSGAAATGGESGDATLDDLARADSVPITQRRQPNAPPTLAAAHAEDAAAEDARRHRGGEGAVPVEDAKPDARPVGKQEAKPDADVDGGELTKTHCQHNRAEVEPPAAAEKEAKVKYLMRERQSGDFHRLFTFVNAIREREVTARFHDGVLHVTVPKGPMAAKKKAVEVYYGGPIF